MRKGTRHPVTVHLPFTDHRAMAAHWGAETAWAIRKALERPPFVSEDLDLHHAVRCARFAAWHAFKAMAPEKEDSE